MDAKICKEYSCYEEKYDLNRQLRESNYLSTFGKTWWKITKGALVIEKRDMIGMLYLCTHNTNYSIYVASKKIDATLWDHRLYHVSE